MYCNGLVGERKVGILSLNAFGLKREINITRFLRRNNQEQCAVGKTKQDKMGLMYASAVSQGYCRPTRLNHADSDVMATPCINRQNIYDKWVSTNVYAMHRPLGQKKQAICFVLRPKYFASGLNPAIFRKQRVTENSARNTDAVYPVLTSMVPHKTPYTELKKVSGESCLKRDYHR